MALKVSFIWMFLLSGILLGVSAELRVRRERPTPDRAPRTPRPVQATPGDSNESPQPVETRALNVEQKDEPSEADPSSSDNVVVPTSGDVEAPDAKSSDGLDGDAISGGIDIEANPGEAGQVNGATSTAVDGEGNPVDLQRKKLKSLGALPRRCECGGSDSVNVSDIRSLSDSWMDGGTAADNKGFSNMLWSFGQFIDHDIVGTVEDLEGPSFTIEMAHNDQTGSMVVHRLDAPPDENGCPAPKNVHTAIIDAGPVYGTDATYLNMILREPNSCKLRESESQLLPITSSADDKGRFFFIAGDVRADEHGLLTCMHTVRPYLPSVCDLLELSFVSSQSVGTLKGTLLKTTKHLVWMREHNRLCDEIVVSEPGLTPDEQFSLARKVVAAKMQQITMTEFLPALGITESNLHSATDPPYDSEFVSVEFATAAFRFGHDLVPDSIGPDFKTVEIFNGEDFFLEHRDGGLAMKNDAGTRLKSLLEAAAANPCARRDGMMSDTLRNTLFGSFGHDLAARNIFRARDMRMPSYEDLADCFGATPDPDIADMVDDAFIGMLQEPDYNERSVIGATTRKIFMEQFKAIFFGTNGHWWKDAPEELGFFVEEVEDATLGIVIRTNTGADVSDDVFHTASQAQSPSTA